MSTPTGNTNPVYPSIPDSKPAGSLTGTSANTATDGTGVNTFLIYTAGTDGSKVKSVRLKPVSNVAATVVRIFHCTDTGVYTAGTTNTIVNTTLIAEETIAAFTASNTLASPVYEIYLDADMPANTKLLISYGTSTGSSTTGFNPYIVAWRY